MASLKTWICKDGKNNDLEIALDQDDVNTSIEGTRITREFEEYLEEDEETYHLDFLFGHGNYSNKPI